MNSKTIVQSFVILLFSLIFISCSNMTVGFEEDSPFYNGPLIDTREDVKTEEKVEVIKEDKVVTQEKKETISQEKPIQIVQTPKENTTQEEETTFSYERDDE